VRQQGQSEQAGGRHRRPGGKRPDVSGAPHRQRAEEAADGKAEEIGRAEQPDQGGRETFQLTAHRHQRVGERIAHLHQRHRDQQRGNRGERSGHLRPPDRTTIAA
jgi:hypothetical protein